MSEMTRLSRSDADRLLSDALDPKNEPTELRNLARIIHAARAANQNTAIPVNQSFIAGIAEHVREARRDFESTPVRPIYPALALRRLPSGRVAAITGALLFSGGVAAAAATGSFPNPIQHALARGLAHVGVMLPDPTYSVQVKNGATKSSSTSDQGVQTSGMRGLCSAYLHHITSLTTANTDNTTVAPSFSRLELAAERDHESVNTYCNAVFSRGADAATHPTSIASSSSTKPAGRHNLSGPHQGNSVTPAATGRKISSKKTAHSVFRPAGTTHHTTAGRETDEGGRKGPGSSLSRGVASGGGC